MTPRPRTVDDATILEATSTVIGRVGPAKLTLARVAEEVGLAPATLVQRFGSKRGLLLALGKRAENEDGSALVNDLREKHGSPLAALREFLLCFAKMAKTPDEFANHLAAYQMDIVDAELRRIARDIVNQQQHAVAQLLADALDAREIRKCDPKQLAPVLLAVVGGSLLAWAVHRKGTARNWAARHLGTALEPYVVV